MSAGHMLDTTQSRLAQVPRAVRAVAGVVGFATVVALAYALTQITSITLRDSEDFFLELAWQEFVKAINTERMARRVADRRSSKARGLYQQASRHLAEAIRLQELGVASAAPAVLGVSDIPAKAKAA